METVVCVHSSLFTCRPLSLHFVMKFVRISPATLKCYSATSSIAINDADDEDSGKKDLDTIVISKTLQDATAAENTSSMTAETNADGAEDASSDDMGSESDESQEANSEDSDVDAN